MSEMLEAALDYAGRGWPVFPCRADKTPYLSNGVLDATTNPETIRQWWEWWPRANVAMNVGAAGMMVLDLDPGCDLGELKASVGPVPATALRQSTPRGGKHWFFRLNADEVVPPSASKIAPHIDVRSFNSYVLLAPSQTADGIYSWDASGNPAHRTDGMVRAASVAREKSVDRDAWIIEPDLPENVEDAIAWLKKDAKIAVEGQGGDNMAYATAAHLKSFGISQALAFDLMWEHWNPRCTPPWSADEVEHLERKVENGYSYNTSPPGNITAAYKVAKMSALFKPVPTIIDTGREVTAGRFRFVDREGMRHIRQPEWLVKDFIPQQSFCILVGERGTFKTFIALDIALSVATGVNFPWNGVWPTVASGPVLFAVGEGRPQLKQRVAAWEETHWNNLPVHNFILGDPVPNVGEDMTPFLEGAKALHDRYALVVVDTLGRAMQGLNENSQEHASKFTRMVETLQHALGAAVLTIAHEGHDSKGRVRGSTVFEADADTVVRVERPDKSMVVALSMTKQKDAPEWSSPVPVQLIECGPSLVATKPAPSTALVALPKARKEVEAAKDAIVLETLDKALAAVLGSNPTAVWSGSELASAIAMRPEIHISGKSLANRYLPMLREDKEMRANRMYDPMTKRWRYAELG